MSNQVKKKIQEMVSSLVAGDPVAAEKHFRAALDNKLGQAMEYRRRAVAAGIFGTRVKTD